LQDALATFEQLGNVPGQAKALGNLARLQERSGDRAGAERNYQRAAELFHQVGEKGFEADTYRVLSQMQLQRGRWLESLASYDRALAAKGGSRFLRWLLQIPLRLLGMR
ncbi:MAG: tetratricopeptide repeat protein, partial [Anaerolineales bacterium]|nr:tetratricopeptide repeat protein [Anaerolineales bacterium]